MRFTLPMIALAALSAVAVPAVAAPQGTDETVEVRISYDDLDLAKAEDRAALEQRVEAELRRACTMSSRPAYVVGPLVDEKCVKEARTVALAEVERLAAAEARRGRTVAAN
ncbi:UrcA family protein [Erythrobacter sp. HL-111]|uniref:UrcA family protein n=1 Tax=Erythrobacter sp. HL-111 TaxID=1798193 RepID=UPI0006D9D98F|nr:UrcA family protein [Erythrobacter sp. HL-111]KPP94793.1 MAG: UrcA family protein [Erythrobacteraceae bacterium HL-111]SDS85455.1 UrcA family protein [Erythrobacter sp. HL-111]